MWSIYNVIVIDKLYIIAVCYRNVRQHKEAKDAYIKAADAYYNNNRLIYNEFNHCCYYIIIVHIKLESKYI